MKSILLPTDLSLSSLYPVHEICRHAEGQTCKIYLIHTLHMPSGIGDLLFQQQRKPYNQLTPQFLEVLELLRKKYAPIIQLLSFEFLWSNSRIYLRHYLQSRAIESIYILKDHHYKQALPQSASCISSLHRCQVPIVYVEKAHPVEFGVLTPLLYKEKMPA